MNDSEGVRRCSGRGVCRTPGDQDKRGHLLLLLAKCRNPDWPDQAMALELVQGKCVTCSGPAQGVHVEAQERAPC
jgi:hypothetical protein